MGLFSRKKKKRDLEENLKKGIDPYYGNLFEFGYEHSLPSWSRHLERLGIDSKRKNIAPIQLQIKNTTDEIKKAVLFGNNWNLLHDNFGSDEGIEVVPIQSNISYLQVLQSLSHDPIQVNLIRVQSTDTSQVTQVITINSKDPNGQEVSIPIITQSYFSAMQMQAGIIDVPFVVRIDGNTQLSVHVRPKATATITFFYERTSDLQRSSLIEQLKEVGVTPEFIDAFMKKKEKKDRRKARVARFKKRLGYIFSFKWIVPKKKDKKVDAGLPDFKGSVPVMVTTEKKKKDEECKPLCKEVKERKYTEKNSPLPEKVEETPAENTELSPAQENEREDSEEYRSTDGNTTDQPKDENGK